MRVIGLTGGIACGKSTVSAWLRGQAGCAVIDGDQISRKLTGPGGAALPRIRESFGDCFFLPDGSLNRRMLSSLVFSDPAARESLDALMAPLLENETRSALAIARSSGVQLCFLDYPLLFEKGYDRLCDTVWCVSLPRALQLKRLTERDHLTEAEALKRMDAVLSSEEKAARSQVVIDNSGPVSYTLSLLPPLLEAERAQAGPEGSRRRRSDKYAVSRNAGDDDASGTAPSGTDAHSSHALPAVSRSRQEHPELPDAIDRPASIRRKPSDRKIQWRMPVWLAVILAGCAFLLLAGVTAQSLMQAYLARQAEAHRREAGAILAMYPLEYREIIEEISETYNLRPAFVTAIIRNESSFQPRVESSVGARGLMQLMPDTAEWIAGKMRFSDYSFERMYDPASNVRFGCWYLNYLAGLFRGDPVCVACAYHAGQGQVTAWLSDPQISPDGVKLDLSRMSDGPTKTYAGRVLRAYGIYQTLYFDGASADDVLLPRRSQ